MTQDLLKAHLEQVAVVSTAAPWDSRSSACLRESRPVQDLAKNPVGSMPFQS